MATKKKKKKAATVKTTETTASVAKFVSSVADPARRRDCKTLVALMRRATGEPPKMWGSSIVGFGNYHYVYASGREGDWMLTGFSPRKQNLTLYVMPGFAFYRPLLAKIGKYKLGKSCLYLSGLEGVDLKALEELVRDSAVKMRARATPKAQGPVRDRRA